MPNHSLEGSRTFDSKSPELQQLIMAALDILEALGVPLDFSGATPRRLEKMALAFLACGGIRSLGGIKEAKCLDDGHALKTREIIAFNNEFLQESMSPGSYDDVRRKDLVYLVEAGIVMLSNPGAATNDSTRGATGFLRYMRNWCGLTAKRDGRIRSHRRLRGLYC